MGAPRQRRFRATGSLRSTHPFDQRHGTLIDLPEWRGIAAIHLTLVIPAKAGIHLLDAALGGKLRSWIPAFAGMTGEENDQ